MDFQFTDEQNHLRRSIREFAEGEILPHVMEWDEVSHFPVEIMPKLAEMGLLGILFPEARHFASMCAASGCSIGGVRSRRKHSHHTDRRGDLFRLRAISNEPRIQSN